MPSRRRNPISRAILENRAAIAYVDGTDGSWCKCSLSILFNRDNSRGIISLRLITGFEGYDNDILVTLRISPRKLTSMECSTCDMATIPSQIRGCLSVNTEMRALDQILTISLDMSAPGSVLVPENTALLTPREENKAQVRAFQNACQATRILLYVRAYGLADNNRAALQNFAEDVLHGKVDPSPLDLQRMYNGRGGRETTWKIFDVPESPPVYTKHSERPTDKRAREESPNIHTERAIKRPACYSRAVSPSPFDFVPNTDTETDFSNRVLSPSSATSSTSANLHIGSQRHPESGPAGLFDPEFVGSAIRDAIQGTLHHAVRIELQALLPGILQPMVRDTLRETLREALHEELAKLRPKEPSNPAGAEAQRTSQSSQNSAIETLVVDHLPRVVREYLDNDEGPLDDLRETAELQFREAVDDALLELKDTRDECITEIKSAETDVLERLTGIDWDIAWERIYVATPSQKSSEVRASCGEETGGRQLRVPEKYEAEPHWRRERGNDTESTTSTETVSVACSNVRIESGSHSSTRALMDAETEIERDEGAPGREDDNSSRFDPTSGIENVQAIAQTEQGDCKIGLDHSSTQPPTASESARKASSLTGSVVGMETDAQELPFAQKDEWGGRPWPETSPTQPYTEVDDSVGGVEPEGERRDGASAGGDPN